jgi:hypothetical protein
MPEPLVPQPRAVSGARSEAERLGQLHSQKVEAFRRTPYAQDEAVLLVAYP